MARVSIVIPAYNAARFLGQTLDSVLHSTFRDLDVIVVDDGSTDSTAALAAGYGPRVKVISRPNAGMSASRNVGIDAGDSEFIALLDSDDVWHPEKLRWQLAALSSRPDHDFCYTAFTFWEGAPLPDFSTGSRAGWIDEAGSGWIYHQLILENWALPSSLLFRRSAWRALGPFLCDVQQTDDWEFLVRASRSHRFLRLAESMVLYRQHPGSLSRKVSPVNVTEEMRESLISRFGLSGPDGTPVDLRELNRLRMAGRRNFADSHCVRGDLAIGLAAFGRLVVDGPERARTLEKLAKSVFRRFLPKRA